jgi:hypothetical protein
MTDPNRVVCENCLKDLSRDVVARNGVPVNCMAYACKNMELRDGWWKSRCEPLVAALRKTVWEWSKPSQTHKGLKDDD